MHSSSDEPGFIYYSLCAFLNHILLRKLIMNKITILIGLQVLMVLFALFELYVAYVSPTIKDTITFVVFSFVCITTFVMLKQRVSKLKSLRIKD